MRVDIPITAEISRNSRTVQYIPIGQGDNAYRFLVSLKNSGAAVEIPDSATVVLNCLKPDGTYTETVGSVKDGTAVFETASNTVAVPGMVICEMQIFDGTQLTAQKFELRVEPSIISDDVIKSTDEYGLLIALIGKVEKLPAELHSYIDAKVDDEVTEAKAELSKQFGDEVKNAVDKAEAERLKRIKCETNIPSAHMEGFGNKAICKLDSRIKYVPSKGFYCAESDQSLIGEHINVFLPDIFGEKGYKMKYRGCIKAVSKTNDGNGYKITDDKEITTAVSIMTAEEYIPNGFYGSLIIHGGIYGDTDVEIPESFYAHAGGVMSVSGLNGETSGVGCEASGFASRAAGYHTRALGERANASGYWTVADGNESNARGMATKAAGYASEASGANTKANGDYSNAQNRGTVANGDCQSARGAFNIPDNGNKYLDIVGNGSDEEHRANAYALDRAGNAYYSGTVYSNGSACLTYESAERLLSESVGTFAMTNYVGSVSGGLRISLGYPIEASGWRLFVGGKEITDRLIGVNEAFVTAPAILDGEPLIKFYRDDDTVLEAKAKVTVKTDKARMGRLMIMQNAE